MKSLSFWRSNVLGVLAAAIALAGCQEKPKLTGWRAEMKEVRFAMMASEEDPTLTRKLHLYKAYFARATGLPVRLYEASDYNGKIQAISSGQVDVTLLASASYANVDAQIGELADPILTVRRADGELGYYSMFLVRADSPYHTLADLKGKTMGYVDLNSTSGYLYPRSKMRAEGIDPDSFFGKVAIAGGHTQAIMALENGQFDATVINVGGGDPVSGFTTGAQFTMARRGLVRLEDFRPVWTVGPMATTAVVVRADRPQAFIDLMRGAMAALPYDEPQTWVGGGQADGTTVTSVDREHYREVIELRHEELLRRRTGASKAAANS
jgi:phosphonate transport system substrate-binding protein